MTAAFLSSTLFLLASFTFATAPAQAATPPPKLSSSLINPGQAVFWDESRWNNELAAMKQVGMSSLVLTASISDSDSFQAGSSLGAKTAYYPTTVSGYQRAIVSGLPVDVVGMALKSAKNFGLTVWLGLQVDNATWFSSGQIDPNWLASQASLAGNIAQDLWSQYGPEYQSTIAGWYVPYENNNYDAVVSGSLNRPMIMHSFFSQLSVALDAVSSGALQPQKPIMISPFYFSALANSSDYQEFWRISLAGTSIDVVALQAYADLTNSYQETDNARASMVSQWTAAVSRGVAEAGNGAQTWANIELFQSNPNIGAATMKYALVAIQAAAPYVSAFTSFSFSSHWSPWAIGYNWFNAAYQDYLGSGSQPPATVQAPTAATSKVSNSSNLKISWQIPNSGKYHLVYFEIFSTGPASQRVFTASWDSNSITIPASIGTQLAIRSVDAAGNTSAFSTIKFSRRG